ncbi:MAG: D-2-hydroxyacid dehydrogenase [Clostridiales bacterium]|nr:D-2-hydroxyacid dehydrogenase [Clostridiales bacterium]
MIKIIVLNKMLKPEHRQKIEDTAKGLGAEVFFTEEEKDIPEDLAEAEIMYGYGLDTARTNKNLKWLCIPYAGCDALMKPDSFANKDCILTNSSGAYGVTIAEHMIAVSLMMMRNLTDVYEESLGGIWGPQRPQRSLKDSRITVLGTGDIGTSFAKRVKAFEPASVTGISRSGINTDPVYDKVLKTEDLDSVLPCTDLLAMSLPGTPETRNILSKDRIARLPEGSFVVNVGRGSAIDEDALADALESGHLAGAALDVFGTEPLPGSSRLWKTKNLLITPHVAGNLTLEHTLNKNVDMFCNNLKNYMEGKPLTNLVDRTKGY